MSVTGYQHLWDVDLVAQYEERHGAQAVVAEEAVELLLRLHKPFPVNRVHQEHDGVHLRSKRQCFAGVPSRPVLE